MADRRPVAPLVLLVCPILLFLAWGKFLLPPLPLYGVDYASRLLVILAFFVLGGATLASPPLRRWDWRQGGGVLLAVGGLLAILFGQQTFWGIAPWYLHIDRFPPLPNEALKLFDLTVGLLLVAVSEELAFRRVPYGLAPGAGLASSLAFGLLHAPQGLVPVIATTLAGGILWLLYQRTGRLLIPIAVHYGVNLLLWL